MAQKATKIDIKEVIDFYENNNISIRNLSLKFKINSNRCRDIIKQTKKFNNSKRKTAWNKGKTRFNDESIAKSSKKLSDTRKKDYKINGYELVYSTILKKRVKKHDEEWFKNTGSYPNSKKGEQIHHIDGDKLNNDFNNLLLTNVKEHSKIHKELEEVFFKLYKLGLISFDKNKRGIDWVSFNELIKKLSQLD